MLGERSTITWTVAILVGIAQVVAGVFPGTSRSGATIFVALLAGTTNRAAATEFDCVMLPMPKAASDAATAKNSDRPNPNLFGIAFAR